MDTGLKTHVDEDEGDHFVPVTWATTKSIQTILQVFLLESFLLD